jgi:Mg-chelatase subunit ChlD
MRLGLRLGSAAIAALCMLLSGAAVVQAQDNATVSNVMLIVDASGSMKKMVGGESRMAAAKRVLADTLATIPADVRLGLLAYGHRKAKDCTDMELVSPIGAEDAATIAGQIQKLTPKGETPIAASLEMAAKSFLAFKGQQNAIVLVTDGIEECKGDPCAAAAAIKAAGLDLKVNIVGFTLTDAQRKLIECVTTQTGGTYYDAKNGAALKAALTSVTKAAIAKPKAADDNLLDPKNGGVLVAAADDDWLKLNDGKEDRAVPYAGIGVYAFKDGKPATLTGFDMLIPEQSGYNVKDFELFAGDESPTGAFHSIGTFTTQNIKLMQDPYQHFTFPPVTARYLKVSLNTDHGGGYIAAYEFRAHGKVDETASPASAPAAAIGIDLLSPQNGGALVAAPNDEWSKLNDGSPDRAVTYSGEGVWAFKDGQAATFDRFEMLIPATDTQNVKEFELLAGDESPTGSFHSLGTFTTQNIKFMQAPYQAFTFAPVTAKYLKVALKTDWGGGYIAAYDFKLLGRMADEAAAGGIAGQMPGQQIGQATPDAGTQPAATQAAPAADGLDLLAPANGGTLVAAPNDDWQKLNDGSEDVAVTYSGEGIWQFKDGAPASFDTFEVLIPAQDPHNVKDFELQVGDEGPTGAFRSIGTFTTQNIKLMQSPYQRFTFALTTAKFLKVILKTDWGGGYISAYEFHLKKTGAQ